MKARAKDRTNARQDEPAETGGNPKAPPKSGFPFAASIENVLSGDEGEDDFVLVGAGRRGKGGEGEGEEHDCHAQPFAASAAKTHGETGPRGSAAHCVGTAFHRGDGDYAPPGSTSNRQADDPQVLGAPFMALFAKTHEETGPRGSAAHFFWGGRHSIGGMTNQASPRSATNHHAHDPQVSGAPLAASFAQPHEETGPRGPAFHRGDGRPSLPRERVQPPCHTGDGRAVRSVCLYIPPRDPW